jgi:hypothetical protein
VHTIASRLISILLANPHVLCGRADRLGKVFFPVKSDVGGNVDKLKKALAAAPAETLQALILAEKATGKHKDKNSAACALLWFKRCHRRAYPADHSYARCVPVRRLLDVASSPNVHVDQRKVKHSMGVYCQLRCQDCSLDAWRGLDAILVCPLRAMEFVFTMLRKVSEGMEGNKAAKEAVRATISCPQNDFRHLYNRSLTTHTHIHTYTHTHTYIHTYINSLYLKNPHILSHTNEYARLSADVLPVTTYQSNQTKPNQTLTPLAAPF